MPQSTSVTGKVTATVADLTDRTDVEVRFLAGVAVAGIAAGVAVAGTIRAVQVLTDLGASFTRRARH